MITIMFDLGALNMEYMTVKEAAEKWGVSVRQVQYGCEKGQVENAIRTGHMWLIHKDTLKPVDGRRKAAKQRKKIVQDGFDVATGDRYELRLYDATLLAFELVASELGGYAVNITKIGEPQKLMPLDLEITSDG